MHMLTLALCMTTIKICTIETHMMANDARIKSTVHYKQDYVNAFWNGNQMVYGDGDGQDYYPFAAALDVVGHELTHAVTEYTAGLEYQNESGAINEAMSDIFGTLIEFYANDNPDWLCAEDIVGPTKWECGNEIFRRSYNCF